MADLPFHLEPGLAVRLVGALDVEGKIPRVLDDLGPLADRDVVLVDGGGQTGGPGVREQLLVGSGARVTVVDWEATRRAAIPDQSADVIVAFWSDFRGDAPDELAEAARIGRPGARLLVVHDYGRDDVARLRGELPEHDRWSRRGGPFLRNGFKVRVVHCWWTFESMDAMRAFLTDAFGAGATDVIDRLTRPTPLIQRRGLPSNDG